MYASDAQNIEYVFSAGIYSWIPNSEVRVCASGSEIQTVSPPLCGVFARQVNPQ